MSDVREQHMDGNDSPITKMEEDRYGFGILAEKLAHSIVSMDRNIVTGSFKPSGLFPPALQK